MLQVSRSPGFVVTNSGSLIVSESNSQDNLTISLSSEPTAAVTLCLSVSNYCEATILAGSGDAVVPGASCVGSVAQLDFDASNWSNGLVVVVEGRHDAAFTTAMGATLPEGGNCDSMTTYVGDSTFTVTGSAVSSDSNYSGLTMATVTGTIVDNKDLYSFTTPAVAGGGNLDANTNGNGMEEADAYCASTLPAALSGTGTYKALMVDGVQRIACVNSNCSTADVSDYTDWPLQTDRVYFRSDGKTRAMTTAVLRPWLIFGQATNQGFEGAGSFWTGFGAPFDWTAGVAPASLCGSANTWDSNSAVRSGAAGLLSNNTVSSLRNGAGSCNIASYRLVCIQQ